MQVVMCYHGHSQEVRVLLPLGDQLISADSGGDVIVWDVQGGGEWAELHLHFLNALSCPVSHHALLSLCQMFTYGCSSTPPPST